MLKELVATGSRRVFAAAALAVCVIAALPAFAEPVAPLVSAQWLKQHQGDPGVLVLDIRSAIDGGGAEAYAKAHIPGAVHSDYDKAGWRVTRNGVPFMLPNKAGLEKLIGETGIDEDAHVVVARTGGGLLQHRPLGGDRLVRAVGRAGPARRTAVRRVDGRMDRQLESAGRKLAHAP